mmetsp:Transcript_17094/g.34630  ORF Transcript_17094/g.34630 Transcript_17094/m.34630 type:complete len:114 (+) Transcript_17094:506-847(+)
MWGMRSFWPTSRPTPSIHASAAPSRFSSSNPNQIPSIYPIGVPSGEPTLAPITNPTSQPTTTPTPERQQLIQHFPRSNSLQLGPLREECCSSNYYWMYSACLGVSAGGGTGLF